MGFPGVYSRTFAQDIVVFQVQAPVSWCEEILGKTENPAVWAGLLGLRPGPPVIVINHI